MTPPFHTHVIPIPRGFTLLESYTELSIFGRLVEPFDPRHARWATIIAPDLTCELCGILIAC